jgi:hypoxanthine phosphoribosyltransferase
MKIDGGKRYNDESNIYCTWNEIEGLIRDLGRQMQKINKKYDCVLGITNGGIVPARLLARELDIELIQLIPIHNKVPIKSEMPYLCPNKQYLIVDDIYDTGETYEKVLEATKGFNCDFAFCMSRRDQSHGLTSKILNHNSWIVFPWENKVQNYNQGSTD